MATTRKTAPKAQTVPAATRGVRSDIAKYELFAEWAAKEHGVTIDPEQAQFTALTYKHFQASDLNKKFNEAKSAALVKGRDAAAKSAAARTKKAAPAPTTKPSVKATAKVTAKAAPAKKAAAPAKATKTTRTRKAAA